MANTELLGPGGFPTVQAIAAAPCEFITKIGFDAPGIRSSAGFHFDAAGRSAVHTPLLSLHTAVANPAALMCTTGKVVFDWSAGETSVTEPQLPPVGLERDQSWSRVVISSHSATELPFPSMAAAASKP
jgi:hypothetical protein